MARKKMFRDIPGFDDYLRAAYCDKRMTMRQIADEIGSNPVTVLNNLRRIGVKTRTVSDYETTEKKRETWRRIGKASAGRRMTDASKSKISAKNKGRRKRNDYEFGGHEKKRTDGYIKVYVPDHPNSTADGYVMKHILVMEQSIGRYLAPGEVVHHENHVRDDNHIENLRLMTASEHMSMHMRERNEMKRRNNHA